MRLLLLTSWTVILLTLEIAYIQTRVRAIKGIISANRINPRNCLIHCNHCCHYWIIIFHWLLVNRLFTKTPTCCSLDEQHLTQVLKFNSRLISDWLKLSAHYSLPSSMSHDMKAGTTFYFLFIQANRAGKTSLLYTGNYWFLFLN